MLDMMREELFINHYRKDLPIPRVDPPKLRLPPDVAWSFSALERFEGCARQYGAINVKKAYPFVESQAIKDGKETHKMLEDYVQLGRALPVGLHHVKTIIDIVTKGAEKVTGEQDIGFTHMLQPCGTFDIDTSYRGKIDLLVLRKDAAFVLDYKTSSQPREGDEQIIWMAIGVLLKYPQYDVVHGMFVYTKHDARRISVKREHIKDHVDRMIPRLLRLKEAKATNTFLPTPGWMCRFCPVITCEFHPKRK